MWIATSLTCDNDSVQDAGVHAFVSARRRCACISRCTGVLRLQPPNARGDIRDRLASCHHDSIQHSLAIVRELIMQACGHAPLPSPCAVQHGDWRSSGACQSRGAVLICARGAQLSAVWPLTVYKLPSVIIINLKVSFAFGALRSMRSWGPAELL